jgi:hypothetical protein
MGPGERGGNTIRWGMSRPDQRHGGEHTRPRLRIQPERHNRRWDAMDRRNPWILGAVVLLTTACGGADSASKAGGPGSTSEAPATSGIHAPPSTIWPIGVMRSAPEGANTIGPASTTHPSPSGSDSGTAGTAMASQGSSSAPAPPPPTSPPTSSSKTPAPPPPTTVTCNPPEGGGDQDADDGGDPMDGDGCAL